MLTNWWIEKVKERVVLDSFRYSSYGPSRFMFLIFLYSFYCNILSFFPINYTTLYKSLEWICCTLSKFFFIWKRRYKFKLKIFTLHLYISGPSKLNGSFFSGVHFIIYSFVKTELEKYSFGSKWNSRTKPYKKSCYL